MKTIYLLTAILLSIILSGCGFDEENVETFDLNALYDKTPEDLIDIFGDIGTINAEGTVTVEDWKGWDSVTLNFDMKRRLNYFHLFPSQPIAFDQAVQIVESKHSIPLSTVKPIEIRIGMGFRDMESKIKTTNFEFTKDRKKIKSVGVFFDLDWE